MKKIKPPFPPLGTVRIWEENFIKESISGFPKLEWKKITRLVTTNIKKIPECPGLYIFVRRSVIEQISPVEGTYPLIVYVGKTGKLKKRLTNYIDDKKHVIQLKTSGKKIRDNIRVMFKEYKDEITVYYALCPPNKLAEIEDKFIQIYDPIFNSSQKLKEEDFENYNKVIEAELEFGYDAYSKNVENTPKKDTFEQDSIADSGFYLDKPQSAF